jgi:hypothetical protein
LGEVVMKWEYQVETVSHAEGHYAVRPEEVQRLLDGLGPHGWELVTTYRVAPLPGMKDEGVFLIFKRPKED